MARDNFTFYLSICQLAGLLAKQRQQTSNLRGCHNWPHSAQRASNSPLVVFLVFGLSFVLIIGSYAQ